MLAKTNSHLDIKHSLSKLGISQQQNSNHFLLFSTPSLLPSLTSKGLKNSHQTTTQGTNTQTEKNT